jgi:hypothetical protein
MTALRSLKMASQGKLPQAFKIVALKRILAILRLRFLPYPYYRLVECT